MTIHINKKFQRVKVPTIYIHNGVFNGVEGFPPNTKYDVIDMDTESTEDAELCKCLYAEIPHWHSNKTTDRKGNG